MSMEKWHRKKQYKQKRKYYEIAVYVLFIVLTFALFERLTLPETTEDMERRAIEYGIMHEKEKPPKPFVYDGCTFFVNAFISSDFTDACFRHDIAYWYGGTKEERKEADKMLAEDMQASGFFGSLVSYPVYVSVRIFGDSMLTKSVNAHWGFGWE